MVDSAWRPLALLAAALLMIWCAGLFARGIWTPDEPREADIAWRMNQQHEKAVPQLAGEAFCEKPPLTYWLAALPISTLGAAGWSLRLPNLLYALITAVCIGALAGQSAGRYAAFAAAATVSTFLLAYQVAIWLATDAPLLAAVSAALLGIYLGFYATTSRAKLRGYLLMHTACAAAFLCKSAAAWLVPALTLAVIVIWEKRWRELLRWELYAGLLIQIALIGTWVWSVYIGPQGIANLKVFFWNNLLGRFARIDAPAELQYAAAHRNTPGKYLVELPVYLFPWTFLVLAAMRKVWQQRRSSQQDLRLARFGLAAFVPAAAVLSVAATARNIYLAPALPGLALLLAWWLHGLNVTFDRWDVRALRATAGLLITAVPVLTGVLILVGINSWHLISAPILFVSVSAMGLGAALALAIRAWSGATVPMSAAPAASFLAYCFLLVGPIAALYGPVNAWQDLRSLGAKIQDDTQFKPLMLLAPDETTRALVDMYVSTSVERIDGPIDARALNLASRFLANNGRGHLLVQIPGAPRNLRSVLHPAGLVPIAGALPWLDSTGLKVERDYSLPNGRRYALLGAAH